MSGLIGKALKFARSPAGRRAMKQAQAYAQSPEGKARIADARERAKSMARGEGAGKPKRVEPPKPPAKKKPPAAS